MQIMATLKWKTLIGASGIYTHRQLIFEKIGVYVGSDDGNLYAIDAIKGEVVWKALTNESHQCFSILCMMTMYL
jgi:outer membrane protein assembly factor BamB